MNTTLEDKIQKLPPELQREVEQFIEKLLSSSKAPKKVNKLRQDWAGELKEYKDRYTSLELQQKSLEWRGD